GRGLDCQRGRQVANRARRRSLARATALGVHAACARTARAAVTQLVTSRRNPSLVGENLRRLEMRIAVSKTTVRLFSGVGLLLGASLVGANAHAESGALHRWVTAEGTVSYTDDERRVPEKYRDSAETIERGVLSDYGRYTTTDATAHQANAEQLAKRLDALRAMNTPMDPDRGEGDVATSNSSSTVEMRRNVH